MQAVLSAFRIHDSQFEPRKGETYGPSCRSSMGRRSK